MSVELFGCPGSPNSLVINNFPQRVYLTSGSHFDIIDRDEQEPAMGSVLVCGGYSCDINQTSCSISKSCYEWTSENHWQLREEELDASRWAHMMASVPDAESGSNNQVYLTKKYTNETLYLIKSDILQILFFFHLGNKIFS